MPPIILIGENMQESDIIPFKTSPLPEGPWLVFAPHADDETFGMGGSLILAHENSIEVSLLILTDGAQGGDENMPIETLIQTRRQEVLQVMEQAGIVDVNFLEQPDHRLVCHPKLIEQIIVLVNKIRPKSVFFPALTEFHPDHRAAAYIAWQALSECHYEGNVFAYEITSQQACANYLVDITPVIDKKRQIMMLYQSQLGQNNYIDTTIGLNKSRTYTLTKDIEYAEAFYRFDTLDNSLTLNTIEQFRPYWEQENDQQDTLVSIVLQTQKNSFQSIKSVLEQTYQNIELILINNGGQTDVNILPQANESLTRVQIINISPAQNYAAACNQGLELCQGDFIMILDEGELIYPSHIESLVTGIRDSKANIIYCDIETNQESNFNQAFDHALLLSDKAIPLHGLLFSSDYLNRDLQFNTLLNSGEHWDFLMQLYLMNSFKYLNIHGGLTRQSRNTSPVSAELFEHWIQRLGSKGLLNSFNLFEKTIIQKEQSYQHLLARFTALSVDIQSKNSIIDNKEQALVEKNQALHEFKMLLDTKNKAITEKDEAIKEKDEAIKEKDSAISEKNAALEVLNKAITEVNKLLTEQHRFTAEQTTLLSNKEQQLNQVQTQNQLITHSLSWRITVPLRKIKTLFSRTKN